MNFLLLVSKHEPIETDTDEIHKHCEGVKYVMSCLDVKCCLWSLKCVFTKIRLICWSLNTWDDWQGSDHQCPICEGNVKLVPIHIQEVGDITRSKCKKAEPSHSLRCINFSLWHYLLLCWKILKCGKFIELVWITLGCDVVNVVGPVLVEVPEVNGLFSHLKIKNCKPKWMIRLKTTVNLL